MANLEFTTIFADSPGNIVDHLLLTSLNNNANPTIFNRNFIFLIFLFINLG